MTRMTGSLLLSAVICVTATAQQGKRASGPPESKGPDRRKTPAATAKPDVAEVSPNKIVVKFRSAGEDRVPAEAYEALRRLDPQAAPAAHRDKLRPLTELGKECGLKRVTHVFFGEAAADPSAAADHQRKLVEQIRSRYPARSKRAPGSKTPDLSPYFVLEFDGSKDIRQVRKRFEESKSVESAHFDPLVKTKDLPSDPFLSSRGSWGQAEDDLWGLKRINGPKAWETTRGRGVTVAVVDTGLDFDHPDIAGNFWTNTRETPGNGVDDDGNGFVDDVRGWDFPNNDADPKDDNREGHGTHVSGTIAAVAGNGEGIAGVAPEAKVMVVKAIGADGSVEFSVAGRAILYAISNGADVINCSWGPGRSGIIALEIEDLVRFGHSLGVVFVFASGNDSSVVTMQSPMNMKEVLTVGASVPSDAAMTRSNWGRYLDVLAPGGSPDAPPPPDAARRSILSLKSSGFTDSAAGRALVVGERYVRLSGTSMAAPHVSGVAALVLAANPALTNEDVMNVVKASAASSSPVRFDLKEGYGRVDAAAAVALAGKKPPTVQLTAPDENLEIPVGGGTVAVRGKVCGDRLKDYQLYYGRMDEGNHLRPLGDTTTAAVDGDIFSWDTSGLPPGCYTLRLVATDVDGNRFEDMVQVTKSRPGIVRVQGPTVADAADAVDAVVSDHYIAWAANKLDASTGETSFDVVVLDRRTGERSVVRNVPTNPLPLAVSDRFLAYCSKADDANEIMVEDLELHTSARIQDLRDGVGILGISGPVVFWLDFKSGLFTCDIPSGRTTKVSGWAPVEQSHVADGQAVWITPAENVAVCDLATGKVRLLTEDGPGRPKQQPRISGQRIVWLEGSNPNANQVYDIILYDLRDDRPLVLASNRPLAQSLDFSGDLVVWSDARNGNHDVYAYDLATNRESSVTTSGDSEPFVCLAGRTILWRRFIRVPNRPEGRFEAGIEMLDLSAPPSVTVRARR